MARWRKKLFIVMTRNAQSATAFFSLPRTGSWSWAPRFSFRRWPLTRPGAQAPDTFVHASGHRRAFLATALAALGVVYGDIGTSPLYAMQGVLRTASTASPPTPRRTCSASSRSSSGRSTSWSSLKYLDLRHARRQPRRGRHPRAARAAAARGAPSGRARGALLIALGPVRRGAALRRRHDHAGDLGARRGRGPRGRDAASSSRYVVPITVRDPRRRCSWSSGAARRGIGAVFGPVMLVWFATHRACSASAGSSRDPRCSRAVNPRHAVRFFVDNGVHGFLVLGSVVLVRHRRRGALRRHGPLRQAADPARLVRASCFPALLLNYFGQGALLLARPGGGRAIRSTRWCRGWALYPLVVLATVAAVIASQALISGAFSLTRQAVQLGYCPRVTIVHTSQREIGQIYIPAINWRADGRLRRAGARRSGRRRKLAAAYGIAVTGTMTHHDDPRSTSWRATGGTGRAGRAGARARCFLVDRPGVLRRERGQDRATAAGSRSLVGVGRLHR